MKNLTLSSLLILLQLISFAQKNTNERAKWFTNDRFGMFIHWGIYSGAEGYWKGEKIRNDNNYAEWILYRNSINSEEYVTLLERFDWEAINPEEWVLLAKQSGMKYITITAKHHDGFALWDSKVSNYNLANYTKPKRDVIKEISAACKKHGIKLCLYYSHWVDWEHKYGWSHNREIEGITPKEYDIYWQEKVIPQIRELLSNYGEISMLWFDMWLHHSKTVVSKAQLLQLKSLIRELQPNCLVNSRLGLSIEEDNDIDYKTLNDNELGNKKEDFPWQSPATVAHSWGFHSSDTQWKSTSSLLKALIENVSLNGNFMLNIGPRANGDIPYEISNRMLEMGKWLKSNGEAIYGAEAFDLDKNQHDWGRITCRQDGKRFKIYFHIYNWPLNKTLTITGISATPQKIYALADKQKTPLPFKHSEAFTEVFLPSKPTNNYISVLVAEYTTKPNIVDGLVAKTSDGGHSLTPDNHNTTQKTNTTVPAKRFGTIPKHVVLDSTYNFNWKIYVNKPGKKKFDISYSYESENINNKITVTAAGKEISHTLKPTGKTVGEPNQNWHISNFKSHRVGEINFRQKGFYTIKMKFKASGNKNKAKFQWLWVK